MYVKKAGLPVSYEGQCVPDSNLRPGDIVVQHYTGGKTLMMDVTGTHKLQVLPVDPEKGGRKVMTHILAREKVKNDKYRDHCRETNGFLSCFLFQPFVFNML